MSALSLAGHESLPLCCPLELEELDALLDACDLRPGDRVIDLGGGRGDVAIRCATRFGARALSVDRSSEMCAEARRRAVSGVEIAEGDASALAITHDLAVCLGATAMFGGIAQTIEALAGARTILVGDLVALGERAAEAFGIEPIARARPARPHLEILLGPERIARYEDVWTRAVAAHLEARPSAPFAAQARERAAWMESAGAAREELAFAAFVVGSI